MLFWVSTTLTLSIVHYNESNVKRLFCFLEFFSRIKAGTSVQKNDAITFFSFFPVLSQVGISRPRTCLAKDVPAATRRMSGGRKSVVKMPIFLSFPTPGLATVAVSNGKQYQSHLESFTVWYPVNTASSNRRSPNCSMLFLSPLCGGEAVVVSRQNITPPKYSQQNVRLIRRNNR